VRHAQERRASRTHGQAGARAGTDSTVGTSLVVLATAAGGLWPRMIIGPSRAAPGVRVCAVPAISAPAFAFGATAHTTADGCAPAMDAKLFSGRVAPGLGTVPSNVRLEAAVEWVSMGRDLAMLVME